jgi:hypothetical protein
VLDSHTRLVGPSLEDLVSTDALMAIFRSQFAHSKGRGVDRVGATSFGERVAAECAIVERKAKSGNYQFSPFLERLVMKGRGKIPRVLSVPSIRDRLLLNQLKEYLHTHIPSSVLRTLPNDYIRRIVATLNGVATDDLSFIRVDIKAFYDCIPHLPLLNILGAQLSDGRIIELVRRAITTPTVSKQHHRPHGGTRRNRIGIPQGLSISNALANIYLTEVDTRMTTESLLYLRYVDDILMIVPSGSVTESLARLTELLTKLGLTVNDEKSHLGSLASSFQYLGYRIQWPIIGVREPSVETYLHAVAAMITRYRYTVRENRMASYLTTETRKAAFIDELNEKITGAISDLRQYGWLFYFSEINDQQLLHAMDRSIADMVGQIEDFGPSRPNELKRLARTFYEVRYSSDRGYIHNYNVLSSASQRLAFLIRRGKVSQDNADRMTEEEVNALFTAYRQERLARLERDIGQIS